MIPPTNIINQSLCIAHRVLETLRDQKPYELHGPTLQSFCKVVLANESLPEWADLIDELTVKVLECLLTKVNLLSEVRSMFRTKIRYLLANPDFRSAMAVRYSFLCSVLGGEYSEPVWFVLGPFVNRFADQVLALVFSSMREPEVEQCSPEHQTRITVRQEKLYHYIAGWLVRGCLKQGLRLQMKSSKWTIVVLCIRSCVIRNG